jgi:hypothetical protein
MNTTTKPPQDKQSDWQPKVSCRKLCCHVWTLQATLRCIRGLGYPELYQKPKTNRDNIHSNPKADGTTQTPHEVAMQNGKLSDGSKWRTLGVPPPHCKPNHKNHLVALIWKRDQMPCSGNAGALHRHQHYHLHHKKSGTKEQSKDVTYRLITCLIRPKKKPNQTRLVAGGDRVHYPIQIHASQDQIIKLENFDFDELCVLHHSNSLLFLTTIYFF